MVAKIMVTPFAQPLGDRWLGMGMAYEVIFVVKEARPFVIARSIQLSRIL